MSGGKLISTGQVCLVEQVRWTTLGQFLQTVLRQFPNCINANQRPNQLRGLMFILYKVYISKKICDIFCPRIEKK